MYGLSRPNRHMYDQEEYYVSIDYSQEVIRRGYGLIVLLVAPVGTADNEVLVPVGAAGSSQSSSMSVLVGVGAAAGAALKRELAGVGVGVVLAAGTVLFFLLCS